MDAQDSTVGTRIPEGLTMNRLWQWCVKRTIRDYRLSVRARRPITRPNLERLFSRRWWSAKDAIPDRQCVIRRERSGRQAVRTGSSTRTPRFTA